MLVHWIWLCTRPGVNDIQKRQILEAFSEPEDAYCATQKEYLQVEGITPEAVKGLMDKSLAQAQKILRQCVNKGIEICTYAQQEYPQRLKHIIDPPLVLYYKGTLPDMNDRPVIAAVGTRSASAYGQTVARRMGYQIVRCGAVLVSGVAKGNDAMAMHGALLAGGTVVGVLGCGVDVVYPKCNRQLFEDIAQHGCLISEFPPETPAYSWNFPRRNRVMSGLSNGVVVIEAPEGSGALITARRAADQGRDVFVVPGNVDMPTFDGSNALLREGATIARDGWDVVGEYAFLYPDKVYPMSAQPELPAQELPVVAQRRTTPRKKKAFDRKEEKKPIDKEEKPPYSDIKEILPTLSDTQRQIVELLTQERLVDEIIEETELSAAQVAAALTMLEIRGIVKRLPGKRIGLK